VPDYIERERQRQGAAREEHLDWLSQQYDALSEQTELLRQQNATLTRIARHTGLMYALTVIGLVVAGVWLLLLITGTLGGFS
jgi:cell division protein FtsB